MNLQAIADFYKENILTSDKFNTTKPCNDISLLFPEFRDLIFTLKDAYLQCHETEPYILETYRSNTLQRIYFDRGASKIRKDGMHHFGISVDLAGLVDEKVNYNVLDYKWLRKYATDNLGLTVLEWELAHFQYIPVHLQGDLRELCNN